MAENKEILMTKQRVEIMKINLVIEELCDETYGEEIDTFK